MKTQTSCNIVIDIDRNLFLFVIFNDGNDLSLEQSTTGVVRKIRWRLSTFWNARDNCICLMNSSGIHTTNFVCLLPVNENMENIILLKRLCDVTYHKISV